MRFDLLRRGLDRRSFGRAGAGGLASLAAGLVATAAAAEGDTGGKARAWAHRAAFPVSSDDRKTQMLVLGNVRNYVAFYKAKDEPCQIEIVAFGPGFSMLRGDISMMKGEIETLQKDLGASLTVSACRNTRTAIAESENRHPDDIPLLPGVTETPSGVVRLAELQGQGYAYLRP